MSLSWHWLRAISWILLLKIKLSISWRQYSSYIFISMPSILESKYMEYKHYIWNISTYRKSIKTLTIWIIINYQNHILGQYTFTEGVGYRCLQPWLEAASWCWSRRWRGKDDVGDEDGSFAPQIYDTHRNRAVRREADGAVDRDLLIRRSWYPRSKSLPPSLLPEWLSILFYNGGDWLRGRWGYFSRLDTDPIFRPYHLHCFSPRTSSLFLRPLHLSQQERWHRVLMW
jgi:hypothetical protein